MIIYTKQMIESIPEMFRKGILISKKLNRNKFIVEASLEDLKPSDEFTLEKLPSVGIDINVKQANVFISKGPEFHPITTKRNEYFKVLEPKWPKDIGHMSEKPMTLNTLLRLAFIKHCCIFRNNREPSMRELSQLLKTKCPECESRVSRVAPVDQDIRQD